MTTLKKLASIPSLTQLYRAGRLVGSSKADLPTSNQELNDKICTIQYDITLLEVDAIVNAANSRLLGGGGVDGAIHRAAGPKLYNECKTLGDCKTGSAKITDAYNLPCKKVIHAVGPVFDSRDESEPLLRGCYRTSLQLAAGNDCKSIAFSAISTGVYGYPSQAAARAALDEVKIFLGKDEGKKIDKVIFVNFMQKDVDAYTRILPETFPPTTEDQKVTVRSNLHGDLDPEEADETIKGTSQATVAKDKDRSDESKAADAPALKTEAEKGGEQDRVREGKVKAAVTTNIETSTTSSSDTTKALNLQQDDFETRLAAGEAFEITGIIACHKVPKDEPMPVVEESITTNKPEIKIEPAVAHNVQNGEQPIEPTKRALESSTNPDEVSSNIL